MAAELPTPPAGLMMVVKAASDPDCTMGKIGQLIGMEPTLTTSLLRMSNSASYGLGRPIRTVKQATVLLGTRTIRNIAVTTAVQVTMGKVDTGDFDNVKFWEDSLRRATAALIVARHAGYEEPSEAFTIGLLQELGILMMAVQSPEHQQALQDVSERPIDERRERERSLMGMDHAELFVSTAREWGLPQDMIEVIGTQYRTNTRSEDRRTARLVSIARVATAISDVVQTKGQGQAMAQARGALSQLPSREKDLELEQLIEEINEHMLKASEEMGIRIKSQPTYQALMEQANAALVDINLSYEELTRRLEQALKEKESLARELQAKNEQLRRLAATDALTQVANRRHFTEMFQSTLAQAQTSGQPVTLLMFDIDHFKKINDTYGHAAGDEVLKAFVKRIAKAIRPEDLVGRLGGEEFGVLLGGCGRVQGRGVSGRIRQAIRSEQFRLDDGQMITVTSSIGGVTAVAPTALAVDDLFKKADEALYESKRNGRDRVTWGETKEAGAPPKATNTQGNAGRSSTGRPAAQGRPAAGRVAPGRATQTRAGASGRPGGRVTLPRS
ncbi:MAG: diguanylate cyclase [Bradymonadia bacterium]